MLNSQRHAIRLSEIREQINGAADDAEGLDSLRAESLDTERQYRAALVAEAEAETRAASDGEGREKRRLLQRAEVRSYIQAAMGEHPLSGAEAELSSEYGLSGHTMPTALLFPELEARQSEVEERADANTTAPSTTSRTQAAIGGRQFAGSVLDFLGVQRASVPVGSRSYPILTAGTTAVATAKDAAKDSTAATFTVTELTPVRVPARYTWAIEDAALLVGFEDSLRSDLRGVIDEELSDIALNGSGTSPEPTGIIAALTDPTDPSSTVTAASFVQTLAEGVDGKAARSLADVRALLGTASYAKIASLFASASDGLSLGSIRREVGGVQASAHVPAASSNIQTAILHKTAGMMPSAVLPMWAGISLIRDPYSEASSGVVALTATALVSFAVLRSASYDRVEFKLA